MTSLIWKDLRLNRLVLVVGGALLLGPYVVSALVLIRGYWPAAPSASVWASYLLTAATFGLALGNVTLGMLAGNAIACERVDRSAVFLGCLPVSRGRVLASKGIVTLVAAGTMWLVHLSVMYGIAPAIGGEPENLAGLEAPLRFAGATGAVAVGVGWAASAVVSSPAVAACCGLGAMFVVPFGVYLLWILFGWSVLGGLSSVIYTVDWLVGVAALVGGTTYYLRRIDP